jgi:Transcriptional regulator
MANIYTPDQKNAKRQAMMQAAVRLFYPAKLHGDYHATSCHCVGSSKGTVFHYFATKEDLFMSILLENYQAYFQQLITELTAGPQLTRTTF